jgi:hypothetical protein
VALHLATNSGVSLAARCGGGGGGASGFGGAGGGSKGAGGRTRGKVLVGVALCFLGLRHVGEGGGDWEGGGGEGEDGVECGEEWDNEVFYFRIHREVLCCALERVAGRAGSLGEGGEGGRGNGNDVCVGGGYESCVSTLVSVIQLLACEDVTKVLFDTKSTLFELAAAGLTVKGPLEDPLIAHWLLKCAKGERAGGHLHGEGMDSQAGAEEGEVRLGRASLVSLAKIYGTTHMWACVGDFLTPSSRRRGGGGGGVQGGEGRSSSWGGGEGVFTRGGRVLLGVRGGSARGTRDGGESGARLMRACAEALCGGVHSQSSSI